MAISSTDVNGFIYVSDNSVQQKFFQNPNFCLCLQKYVENSLSIPIAVIPPQSLENQRNLQKSLTGCTIQFSDAHENPAKLEQIVSDLIKNLFLSIQLKVFHDDKVKEWLQRPSIVVNHLRCLQKLMNEKIDQVFTVCEDDTASSLKIYYLPKEPFSVCHSEEIDKLIQKKIAQETILLPLLYEQSDLLKNELKKLTDEVATKEEVSISIVFVESRSKSMQKEIVLFGYYKIVNRLKQQCLMLIEKHQLFTFKLNALDTFQIDFLRDNCSRKLREIEEEYVEMDVELRLEEYQFLAPQYLKDEIESRITQLLSLSSTVTFKSIQLSKNAAEQAEKHLNTIARRNHCYMKTELEDKSRCYTIPKAGASNTQVSKSIIEQSNQFCCSSNVFNGIKVKNGTIEIRTGDIALQKVDAIVIPMTSNGLKEGVIDRAGRFDYQHTFTDTSGTQFTETNGGTLPCKKILFSNWVPSTISDDENQLRKSIQVFIQKSMDYITQDKHTTSIAFAMDDTCKNEMVLAQDMIAITKQIVESSNLPLKIIFVLLPEQEALHNHFFAIRNSMQDIYTQLEWSTAVKVTLIASEGKYLAPCQQQIENYLKRCTTSSKVENATGIFKHWNSHTINAFYKYCQDECVLSHIDKTGNKIEFSGPINNVLRVKQKWYLLSLYNETILGQSKAHKIMISYCQQDKRMCQRLVHRLIEEGFSVWAEPIVGEQRRDVSSQMNKSDCIILCISDHSSENQSCEQEANYAFQTGKLVCLVKTQNHPLVGWQREVFQEKLFLQLFGSENHFNLEFGRLLLEIQRSDRRQQDNDEFPNLFTVEERRFKYGAKVKRLMEIGHINKEEMKMLIEQLQNVISDAAMEAGQEGNEEENSSSSHQHRKKRASHWKYFNSTEQLACCAKRWLEKPTNMTKQNLPPFSASGDINDARFPIPKDMLNNGDQLFRSLSSPFSTSVCSYNYTERGLARGTTKTILVDDERIYGLPTRKTGDYDNLSQVFSEVHSADDFIPRKTMSALDWSTGYSRQSAFISSNLREKGRRRRIWEKPNKTPNEDEKNATETIKKSNSLTEEEVEACKKKFAQRMQENTIEFEKFCSTYVAPKRK